MKLTLILITAAFLQVSASGFSQPVTLSVRQAPVEKVFRELEKQTGIGFLYTKTMLRDLPPVSLSVKNVSVREVLDSCLKGYGLKYTLENNTVVITRAKAAPVFPLLVRKADLTIRGRVTDEMGAPVPSVSVVIPGTPLGAMTNANGEYVINHAPPEASLVFTYVGYQSQTIRINGRTEINLVLAQEVRQLDQTVVIGYGTTTQRRNTGSVSSITAEQIEKQTIDNPLTALQGRIPGLIATQDNGLPGGGVRVQIRGNNSLGAGTIPLYIIDGVPFTLFSGGQPISDALNAYGTSGANGDISPFSMINPNDIERIDVLKDADATAIYGSRGTNGVVLITTKKGAKGKTIFNINVNKGEGRLNHYIPMMNTRQYVAMRKDAFANAGTAPDVSNAVDLLVWDTTAYTDWQKWALGGTAQVLNAAASLSGGNAQNSFLFSSNYRRQGTVFPGQYNNNNNFSDRLTVGHKSLDGRFSFEASVNYTFSDNNLPALDLSTIFNLTPNYPLYNANGTLNWTLTNPQAYRIKKYTAQTTNFLSNVNLSYKIFADLTIRANLGYTLTSLHQTSTNPASSQNLSVNATPEARAAANRLIYADNDNGNYIVEPQLEYNKIVGKGKLQLLAGSTFQQNKATGVYLTGRGYSSESLLTSLSSAAAVSASYNNYSVYKYNAVFGRANFNWRDRYIVDATFRRDGSSRFGPDHRFGNFGALGAAWIFTKENWMSNMPALSFGKLRASYGLTGNDQISNYLYNALFNSAYSGYSYQGTPTLTIYSPANPDLHWETTRKLDIALELGFLHDKINFKADFYRNRSSDQLLYITIPGQSGFTSYTGNLPALVQNKGWEFEFRSTNIQSKNFTWTTSFNLTFNQNKLLSFPDLANSSYSTSYIIGKSTDLVRLYHYTGPDATTGFPTFADQNGDKEINYADDRIPMKIGTPYYGGLSNTVTYKNLSLDFTFQFNHRFGYLNNTLNDYHTAYDAIGNNYYNQSTAVLNRWSKSNPAAFFPAAYANFDYSYINMSASDINWGDASFIKFKTLSLNYSLPQQWMSRMRMAATSVYVQGQNLFTWAKQKYTLDPETTQPGTGSGLGTGTYIAFPQLRTIVVGINCSF